MYFCRRWLFSWLPISKNCFSISTTERNDNDEGDGSDDDDDDEEWQGTWQGTGGFMIVRKINGCDRKILWFQGKI